MSKAIIKNNEDDENKNNNSNNCSSNNHDVRYVSAYLPARLVDKIEETRGDISRSLWLRRAAIQALREQGVLIEIAKQ